MATDLRRRGHNLAYAVDGNRGNPCLAMRVPEDADAPWKVIGERLFITQSFRNTRRKTTLTFGPLLTAGIVDKRNLWINTTGDTFYIDTVTFNAETIETTGTPPADTINLEIVASGSAATGGGAGGVFVLTNNTNEGVDVEGDLVANTNFAGTVHATQRLVVNGSRICLSVGGTLNEVNNLVITIEGWSYADGFCNANDPKGLVLFANEFDRSYELVGVYASWDKPETIVATCNLRLEKLTVNEAVGGNGDSLIGATNINVKGADDTVNEGTIVTTNNVHVIADTERIGAYFALDAGTITYPNDLDGLTITLELVPTTLTNVATT